MNKKSFTLMEIIIVIVLISVVAAFGIPSYRRAILRSRERQAIVNLELIHAAASFYGTQAGGFLPGNNRDIDFINQNFGLRVAATNGTVYEYDSADPASFDIKVEITNLGGGSFFDIQMDEGPISSTNPCCEAGTGACLSLPSC